MSTEQNSPIYSSQKNFLPALRSALQLWAENSTSAMADRREELIRDKLKAVESFFALISKHPANVSPTDVRVWRENLEAQGPKPNTIYARISRFSSFYRWVMKDPLLGQHIKLNPASLVLNVLSLTRRVPQKHLPMKR